MSASLSRIGFNVTTLTNGSSKETRKALAAFPEKTKSALISFVYYSCHAVEFGGVTWLVPNDGKANSLLSEDLILSRQDFAKRASRGDDRARALAAGGRLATRRKLLARNVSRQG